MDATRILAIRHGETAWNVDTRIQGHLDIPLNDTGLQQARWLAEALAEICGRLLESGELGGKHGAIPRITLTAPVLAGAQNIHILITGAEKRAAIERAARLPALEAPVRVVLDNATVHWAE